MTTSRLKKKPQLKICTEKIFTHPQTIFQYGTNEQTLHSIYHKFKLIRIEEMLKIRSGKPETYLPLATPRAIAVVVLEFGCGTVLRRSMATPLGGADVRARKVGAGGVTNASGGGCTPPGDAREG